jgi:hypothetical protein
MLFSFVEAYKYWWQELVNGNLNLNFYILSYFILSNDKTYNDIYGLKA